MDLGTVRDGIVNGASKAFETIKNGAVWAGHVVKKYGSAAINAVVSAVKWVWNTTVPLIKDAFTKVAGFFRTSLGLSFIGAGAGAAFLSASQSPAMLKDENRYARLALQALAAGSFIATGIAVSAGLSNGFSTPIV